MESAIESLKVGASSYIRKPFETPIWRQCTVHPDCHIVFNGSYYSVPYRFTSKRVWIRAGRRLLRVYFENELIKVHPLAKRKGSWQTDQRDYPHTEG